MCGTRSRYGAEVFGPWPGFGCLFSRGWYPPVELENNQSNKGHKMAVEVIVPLTGVAAITCRDYRCKRTPGAAVCRPLSPSSLPPSSLPLSSMLLILYDMYA